MYFTSNIHVFRQDQGRVIYNKTQNTKDKKLESRESYSNDDR